jgi:hypothetical protein
MKILDGICILSLIIFSSVFIPAKAMSNYNIGIYYIICDNQPINDNISSIVNQAMSKALPRLNSFFSQYGISWSYSQVKSIKISYSYTSSDGLNIPTTLDTSIPLIKNASSNFITEYNANQFTILIFNGPYGGAYLTNYESPCYFSEKTLLTESAECVVIEHEVLHAFGMGDHNLPHSKTIYDDCTMGDVYTSSIKLCADSLSNFKIPSNKLNIGTTISPNTETPIDVITDDNTPSPIISVGGPYEGTPLLWIRIYAMIFENPNGYLIILALVFSALIFLQKRKKTKQ